MNIIMHNLWVFFALVPPLLKKSLREETEI